MKKPLLVALVALFTAYNVPARDVARTGSPSAKQKPEKVKLNKSQKEYLDVYCSKRWWSIFYLRICGHSIPSNPAIDQLKPAVAEELKLPSKATWTDIVCHKKVAKYFAAWDRSTLGETLCGNKDATWDEIIKAVELLRVRLKAGEVGFKATESPFSFGEIGYTV